MADKTDSDVLETTDWIEDYETNRLRKLTLGLEATPDQRLAWLEEMIALAHATGALPKLRTNMLALCLEATPDQRLAWLEEMMILAYRAKAPSPE